MEEILTKKFEEINPYDLKAAITQKFGRISRFARLADYDQADLHKWLRGPFTDDAQRLKKLKEIHSKASKLKDEVIIGIELTEKQRDELRKGITRNGKITIKEFCDKKDFFIQSWISKVLNGDIKKITKKVLLLSQTVKVKL